MNNTNIPAADAPDWGGPYNWAWFKHHHLSTLREHSTALRQLYKQLPLGKGIEAHTIQEALDILDKLILLHPWLPETSGGRGYMREIKVARLKFEKNHVGVETTTASYWDLQEITCMEFAMTLYMESLCED